MVNSVVTFLVAGLFHPTCTHQCWGTVCTIPMEPGFVPASTIYLITRIDEQVGVFPILFDDFDS